MLYTKFVTESGVKVAKVYSTAADTVLPADSDVAVKYKDFDGDEINLVSGDTYFDGGKYADGKSKIVRKSDGKEVNVVHGTTGAGLIPEGWVAPEKEVKKIAVTTKPTKVEYKVNDALDLTGMVVKATYADGDTVVVPSGAGGYTTVPANGATLATAGEVDVEVSYASKTATFKVTVTE